VAAVADTGVINPPTLTVIGTGKLGITLPRLMVDAGQVRVRQIFNPNLQSALKAAHFIGDGSTGPDHVVTELDHLAAADLWLLAVPDSQIEPVAADLGELALPWDRSMVFHCSGILGARSLKALATRGACTASVHPAHSFADPRRSLSSFAGSFCSIEGDPKAIALLINLFEAIGGRVLIINSDAKPLYHGAMTVASNHLVALLESSLRLLEAAGIERDTGLQLIAPLVRQTADNVFAADTTDALTGPILRGDADTIDQHLQSIRTAIPEMLPGYQALGLITCDIATVRQARQDTGTTESGRPRTGKPLRQQEKLQQDMIRIEALLRDSSIGRE